MTAPRESVPIVLVANPESPRVAAFQAALAGAGRPAARVVAYADLLAGRASLAGAPAGAVVRFESPGKNFEVERALLALGANEADDFPGDGRYAGLTRDEVAQLAFDKGEILCPRQWYRGFARLLRRAEGEAAGRGCTVVTPAEDVLAIFDKGVCHARLLEAGVNVPRGLGEVRSHADLLARMRAGRAPRVFVKLAHGSSASGVVALAVQGDKQAATTTVEIVRESGQVRLFNSRRVRTYTDADEVKTLVDALARHRVHVEQWFPKAGVDGMCFDLRVVVIVGRARHAVVRKSRTPMTNLHLLNAREGPDRVRRRMGEAAWAAAMATCEQAAGAFPRSLQVGVDLMIGPDFRAHAVAEVNAFGDLLPGCVHEGQSTYEAEAAALAGAAEIARIARIAESAPAGVAR